MDKIYEGQQYGTAVNDNWVQKLEQGEEVPNNIYVEGLVEAYTSAGDLTVRFGNNFGVIAHDEIEFPERESPNIYRYKNTVVGFYVKERKICGKCFEYTLSRKAVIKSWFDECISKMEHGDIVEGRICHIGNDKLVLADLGYGFMTAIVPINASMINCKYMTDIFKIGEEVKLLVLSGSKELDSPRITVTHKELLGTFEQNATMFKQGDRFWARVYAVHDWGTFVQLTPNTFGLTLNADTSVEPGQAVFVEICGIKTAKSKIQVQILARGDDAQEVEIPKQYFIDEEFFKTATEWRYSDKRQSDLTRKM